MRVQVHEPKKIMNGWKDSKNMKEPCFWAATKCENVKIMEQIDERTRDNQRISTEDVSFKWVSVMERSEARIVMAQRKIFITMKSGNVWTVGRGAL